MGHSEGRPQVSCGRPLPENASQAQLRLYAYENLPQLSAVISALNSTGRVILKDHIAHCIVDAVEADDMEPIEALNQAIDRFMR